MIVRFEIPFARVMPPTTENENSTVKKYVVYDLNVRQDSTQCTDSNPVTIERRYTDFLNLYNGLKKDYPMELSAIAFPKKVFIGNFSSDLIAERSASFEAFLDHVVSLPELRSSPSFLQFLQDNELTRACQLLDERRNEQAVPILEGKHHFLLLHFVPKIIEKLPFSDCFRLLNKIFLDRSRSVLLLLCRLVAATTTSPVPHPAAEKWSELALRRYDSVSDDELLALYIPLLHTCVHLWWQRGRDNKFLEERLKSLESKGIPVKNSKTLTQAIHSIDPRTETV